MLAINFSTSLGVQANPDGTGWLRNSEAADLCGFERTHAFVGFDATSCTELDCFFNAASGAVEQELCVDYNICSPNG